MAVEEHISHFDIALIEWPNGSQAGGPRLLGRISDPDLVEAVRNRIGAARRRELARLKRPARLVRETPKLKDSS
jgi:hypothetical protein